MRDSTAPIPPAAHLVRNGLTFIRQQAKNGIGVKDVVAHLNVSRSLADLRFREIEGRSIGKTIEDTRLGAAEAMLKETKRSIRHIAAACGYRNIKTFEAAFRKSHGIAPMTYRKSEPGNNGRRRTD